MIREIVVYTNVIIGYQQLKRMNIQVSIPVFFALGSVVLDFFFILLGLLRVFFSDTDFFISKYAESYSYLSSGTLFVFCFALQFVWTERDG
jgi:hypothetical protein